LRNRIGILTGGGDVPPLNAVIHSAFEEGMKSSIEVVGTAGDGKVWCAKKQQI